MSMAGMNARANIWRIETDDDDVVGGAVVTGTLQYSAVLTRFQGEKPQQLLLQQGLETQKMFSAIVIPGTLDIRERDEYEVSHPFDHHYYGKRFRIVGVLYSDHNPRDPRNRIILTMVRSERAHDRQ